MYYHNIKHSTDVYKRSMIYGKMEGLSKKDLYLLGIAAIFHDTGYIYRYNKNEPIGAKIAGKYLRKMNFKKKDIDTISKLILATDFPQKPHNLTQKIICDADLDSLGRKDFIKRGLLLRKELEAQKAIFYTDNEWNKIQLNFISKHRYFTKSARKLRNSVQKINRSKMMKLLKQKTRNSLSCLLTGFILA